MVQEEALWIEQVLSTLKLSSGACVVDVGSSTEFFRTQSQPYIEERVFRPLQQRGITIVHVDQKAAPGVDIVVDIERLVPETLGRKFDALLCASLLEHVQHPALVARTLVACVKPGGWLIVTVPQRYPWHPDPIDTGFRPGTRQLAELFPHTELSRAQTMRVDERGRYAARGREQLRYYIPALRWRISCVLLQNKVLA